MSVLVESLFPPDCLIIARISFQKERVGNGIHFVRFLAEIALKYGFKHIGIESVNDKSRAFAEKLGSHSIDGSNYAVSLKNLISFFQWVKVIFYSFEIQKYTGNRTETPSPTGFAGNLHTCVMLRVVFPAKVLPYSFPE